MSPPSKRRKRSPPASRRQHERASKSAALERGLTRDRGDSFSPFASRPPRNRFEHYPPPPDDAPNDVPLDNPYDANDDSVKSASPHETDVTPDKTVSDVKSDSDQLALLDHPVDGSDAVVNNDALKYATPHDPTDVPPDNSEDVESDGVEGEPIVEGYVNSDADFSINNDLFEGEDVKFYFTTEFWANIWEIIKTILDQRQ